jgi:hypothetical protein
MIFNATEVTLISEKKRFLHNLKKMRTSEINVIKSTIQTESKLTILKFGNSTLGFLIIDS